MIISVINQKGGVGKTTTVHNLGAALGRRGIKTLLIDFDPQGSLTEGSGKTVKNGQLMDVFNGDKKLTDVIIKGPEFDVIPANLDLAEFDVRYSGEMGRESKLKKTLKNLDYKYVFLDCGPTLGLLTINALVASDYILIPLQTEFYSISGLKSLNRTIDQVKAHELNDNLKTIGVLLTLFDKRKKLHRDVVDLAKNELGENLFNTIIRSNTDVSAAPSHHMSIFDFAPSSNGSSDYNEFVEEFLERIKSNEG